MMKLRDFILSEENIYWAVYSVKSYVFDPQLLDREDKELFYSLMDPFNEDLIFGVIEEVKDIVTNIINDETYLFKTEVYYKPKDYDKGNKEFRPIHTAKLKQLIAMVAVMHPLVYEIPNSENKMKLSLSNYSRLIPNNFYGNRVSKRPEDLFVKWNEQYKKYTQKANEYFKTFHETKEYKYELQLDLVNFFPSINPLIIYGILVENMPVTLSDDDICVLKTIISKLLVCEISNMKNDYVKELYYGKKGVEEYYTKGIAQGLPQSYFFGNICMIKISEIFNRVFVGKSVYYVDDSYIYTNVEVGKNKEFIEELKNVNIKIKDMSSEYIEKAYGDITQYNNKKHLLHNSLDLDYGIELHLGKKSTCTEIQESKEGEIYLKALSREASQIGVDIISTYSEEEDTSMLHRIQALLLSIEEERKNTGDESYKNKLERYYKFFKYREIKLKLKTQDKFDSSLFFVLVDNYEQGNKDNLYELLASNGISEEKFFINYKHDIWQVAISMLIANTVKEHGYIKKYLQDVINKSYPEEMLECSFISRVYNDYLHDNEIIGLPNYYNTLEKQTKLKLVRYSNMNSNVLNDKFDGVLFMDLEKEILGSFNICSDKFIGVSIIVNMNSDRLKRMFLNAVYSRIFKVSLSDDVVLNSYDKKGISYGELRVLVYLRNPNCKIDNFLNWQMELRSSENMQNIDYTVFEVLGAYKKYVVSPPNIDNLIMIHKYTCDVWKNGAKHLYFYTLHNQEHAVDLVKNIIKIVKVFSYFKISSYDYYILFLACYLHDISMVRIASENDFLLDKGESDNITTEMDLLWSKKRSTSDTKRAIITTYKEIDRFFEKKIRSKHAKDSAEEIRKRAELNFLEESVRESVAEISESHMLDTKDIYYIKGDARNRLISYKFDKILLRIADLLDMSEHRVSKPILNHNIDNMSIESAFHWISHILTNGYKLTSDYSVAEHEGDSSNLSPGRITEVVTLSVFVNLSQFTKELSKECKRRTLNDSSLDDNGFVVEFFKDKGECSSEKCNFLCKWFNNKNNYLMDEMQALESYLSRVPFSEKFYNTKILIRVVVNEQTHILDEQFEILKKMISEEKIKF